MPLDHVFFRADASVSIGSGHVVRCHTIARALRKRFAGGISFIVSEMPDGLVKSLEVDGIGIVWIPSTSLPEESSIKALVSGHGRVALVVDSFKPEFYAHAFQRRMPETVERFVFIAFDNEAHYCAHVLHNQNPRAPHVHFDCEPYTQQLLGLRHVILNECIRELAVSAMVPHPRENVLVALLTFGGSDPHNLTTRTIEALDPISSKFAKLIVVVGSMFPHKAKLDLAIEAVGIDTEVLSNISDMPEVMRCCDIAFTSGGLTNWEIGALGKPLIILPSGEREALSAEYLEENGLAQFIRDPHLIDIPTLTDEIAARLRPEMFEMANCLKNSINIDGVETVVDAILGKD